MMNLYSALQIYWWKHISDLDFFHCLLAGNLCPQFLPHLVPSFKSHAWSFYNTYLVICLATLKSQDLSIWIKLKLFSSNELNKFKITYEFSFTYFSIHFVSFSFLILSFFHFFFMYAALTVWNPFLLPSPSWWRRVDISSYCSWWLAYVLSWLDYSI